jgi:hypothetical protein
MKNYIPIVALAVLVAACGGSSPTQPSAAPSPSPTPSSATNWSVTQTFVSVEGPDNCWIREQRQRWTGAIFPGLSMSITRSDGSIRLESSWFKSTTPAPTVAVTSPPTASHPWKVEDGLARVESCSNSYPAAPT